MRIIDKFNFTILCVQGIGKKQTKQQQKKNPRKLPKKLIKIK